MCSALKKTDRDLMNNEPPEESCKIIMGRIVECMEQFMPRRELVTHPSDPSWWTPECSDAINMKNKTWKKWSRNRDSQILKSEYKHADKFAASRLHAAKEVEISKSKLASKQLRDKDWWSIVKCEGGVIQESSIPTLTQDDGIEYVSSQGKAETLGDFYATKCTLGGTYFEGETFPYVKPRSKSLLYLRCSSASAEA